MIAPSAAWRFLARGKQLGPAAALRAALRAMLGGISRGRAVGIAIGIQQHLVVGALDGAIARRAIAAEDAETRVARGAARAGRTRRPALARARSGVAPRRPSKSAAPARWAIAITISTKVAMNPISPSALNTPASTPRAAAPISAEAPRHRPVCWCSVRCRSFRASVSRLGRLDRTACVLQAPNPPRI